MRTRVAAALVLLLALTAAGVLGYQRGWVRFNYPSASRYPIRGIDVSHHQGKIDWQKVRADGVVFAFIKASEGKDHVDSAFKANWAAAQAAGVRRGAYHFFTFCSAGAAQADHFTSTVGPSFGELAPVADVEFVGNCGAAPPDEQIRVELAVFLQAIERASGRKPLLYFTSEARRRILDSRFAGYPLFPRSIFGEPVEEGWAFWQYAANGRVSGVRTLVDLDAFAGAELEP
ncbi:MAG TPA: GH25 family lysozyme [Myxococcota bacterium]|nr:GH25 family lysozyme [Myxococcota bacterium]